VEIPPHLAKEFDLSLISDWDFPFAFQDSGEFFKHPIVQGMNVAIGGLCWLGLTACGLIYAQRLNQARLSGKRWCEPLIRFLCGGWSGTSKQALNPQC